MNVSYTMFNNYHTAAKEFANGDMAVYGRLMFIINTYAIEGVIVEDLNSTEKLFLTSIKASIDKSIRLAEAGRKGGKHSTAAEETPAECTEMNTDTSFVDENNEACKPFEMACNEIEEEKEKEILTRSYKRMNEVKNKIGNPPDNSSFTSLFGSDFIPSSQEIMFFDWISAKRMKINKKNKHYILDGAFFLKEKGYDTDFLDYVYDSILCNYRFDQKNIGLIIAAFSWDETIPGYEAITKHNLQNIKLQAPKKCTVCGSGLVERLPGTFECPECRKKGNPIWWELNTSNNKWVCSL